jgi:thioesterase domain-containing protein
MWGLAFPMSDSARFPTLRDLARLYIGLIRTVQPDGPYLLGGYSFGGNLAVEMALQLEAQGEKVEQVLLVDSHPPEAYIGGSADREDFVAAFPALVAAILPGGQPPGMDKELAAFFDVWVHNHQALKRWYPDALLQAELVVFAATEPEDPTILQRLQIRLLPKESWAHHTETPPRIVPLGGTHYSLMRDDTHLRALAAAIDNELERARP